MSQQTVCVEPDVVFERPQSQDQSASRRGFLALSAAACGAALVLGAAPARAMEYGDQQLLRYLEEVERVQQEFFTRATLSGTADGLQEREANTINLIAHQDAEHVSWCVLASQKFGVGSTSRSGSATLESPRPATNYLFPAKTFERRASLYSLALSLKETAVAAYHGAVARADDPEIVQAIAALAGVEGRHLAMMRELAGQDPFVTYEVSLSPRQVANKLSAYGFNMEVL